jgi:flavodoxin
MKTAIIYKSVHHGNTKKIAKVMADTLEADLFDLKDVNPSMIKEYDLIGFGSGIYYYRPHKKLRKFVEELDTVESKKAFHFSTSGNGKYYAWLEKKLSSKGFQIMGEFHCKGFDTYAFSKIIGGINKGKPDEEDIENARNFANSLREKVTKGDVNGEKRPL